MFSKLTLIVPCYNEAERFNAMPFVHALDKNPTMTLLFVNDGSKDHTLSRLQNFAELRPGRIQVLDLPQNGGKAEAVRQGLLAATQTNADLVGYWDADLATPLYAIEDMIKVANRLPDVKMIFGSRRLMVGHKIDRTMIRRLVSKVCSSLASIAVRLPVGDTQCGAKMMRNTPELRAAIADPFTADWLFDVELFSRIAKTCAKPKESFYEFPLLEWDEVPGSKVTSRAILKSGFAMLRLIAREQAERFGLKKKQLIPQLALA